jgi:serine/threonine-protein kinase
MEWVDGFDLRRLLGTQTMLRLRDRVDKERFEYVNDVIVTEGPDKLRLKPGVSIAILRECLAGLAALHRQGIVHGDVKPANIMVKRTGNTKLVDFGSAFVLDSQPVFRTWTPMYAAPELLERGVCDFQSDLASIGYVLIEMLSGVQLFPETSTHDDLLQRKRQLPDQLVELLPDDVGQDAQLLSLIHGLIAVDPQARFESAEDAELTDEGAAEFERQLVKGDLSSEYENEIRLWLDEVG